MHLRRSIPGLSRTSLLAILCLSGAASLAGQNPSAAAAKEQKDDAAGFKEFSDRLQTYMKVHKSAENSLPKLKPTEQPEVIVAGQRALAAKIREARANAHLGDIFTPRAREAFRHVIHGAFRGPDGPNTRATIQQGVPVREVHLVVNQVYPDTIPRTTVPPTFLLLLPKLPDDLEYRIVGRDFVLLDIKANLVVDLLHEVLPPLNAAQQD